MNGRQRLEHAWMQQERSILPAQSGGFTGPRGADRFSAPVRKPDSGILGGSTYAGDPASDPWAWRQVLASNTRVAYGKFFDKKAGFVSREWFPVFANYRRDGYDYEGMYEDGRMNSRCKRILDALELNEDAVGLEMLSCDLRKKAALEKGFEGALTDLQMHAFLLMNDFRQRRNRQGMAYGWHTATLMTPETKWGYDAVNSCGESPADSWERIRVQIRKYYPHAEEDRIRRVIGIRK